jgi:hypothetical protein
VEPHQWWSGAFGVTERGQRGLFPLADSPGPGRAHTQSLGVRASSPPAIPSRVRDAGRRGAVELVAERGKGEEEDRRERRLTAGSQPSAREAKKKKEGEEVGPPWVVCLLGRPG